MNLEQLRLTLLQVYSRSYGVDDVLIYKRSVGLMVEGEIVLFLGCSHIKKFYGIDLAGVYYNPKCHNIRELIKREKEKRVKLKNVHIY